MKFKNHYYNQKGAKNNYPIKSFWINQLHKFHLTQNKCINSMDICEKLKVIGHI